MTKTNKSLPDPNDLIRYGMIVSDTEFNSKDSNVRIRKINYEGILYHLRMQNGNVEKLIQWDGFVYNETASEIKNHSDEDLLNLFMFSSRDRKKNKQAESVYWLCIDEINCRDIDQNQDD